MGVMMANRGLKMTQSGYDFNSLRTQLQQTWERGHPAHTNGQAVRAPKIFLAHKQSLDNEKLNKN